MRMTFGKYKGYAIESLPDDYIVWLHELPDLREPIRGAVKWEYWLRFRRRREYEQPQHRVQSLPEPTRHMASELITAGFRVLSKEHHPDLGGSHEDMLLVNAAAEFLREAVEC